MVTISQKKVKQLFRSKKNRVLTGVCGGIGEYLNVDPVVIRLIWTILTVFTGLVPGVLTYILAVIIIPDK